MQLANTSPLKHSAQRSHKLVSQRLKAKLFARLAFAAVHARGEKTQKKKPPSSGDSFVSAKT
jgi:hypothetical protein